MFINSWSGWFQRVVRSSSRGGRRTGRPRRPGFRPGLEQLEGRALLSAGALDPTFGAGSGAAVTDFFGADDQARSVAVQADGKIVVAGSAKDGGHSEVALARYNADGTLDTSFGHEGKALVDFGGNSDAGASSVAIQADGKIVAAGFATFHFGGPLSFVTQEAVLVRVNPDGTPDSDFDADGKTTIPFGGLFDEANGVALQADGKIVVAGTKLDVDSSGSSLTDFALARYNPDGSPDLGFHFGGTETTSFEGGRAEARGVAIQADGRIVVAGVSREGDITQFALARYLPDGSPDSDFDADGKVTTNFGATDDEANSVALQADGKIVVAGVTDGGGSGKNFALARYNANGHLDTTFGTDGRVVTNLFGIDKAESVAVQADDKIVAAGRTTVGDVLGVGLARYNADGTLDSGFGDDGKVSSALADEATGVALQADGKIVVVGMADSGDASGENFALLRYENDRLHFSGPVYTVGENGGSAAITVTRTGGTTGTLSVVAATSDGTATAGADYTPVSTVLTFHSGETSKTFTISIRPDTLVEGNETVLLSLSSAAGGASLGFPAKAVLTIVDAPAPLPSSPAPPTGPAPPTATAPAVAVLPGRITFNPATGIARQRVILLNLGGQALAGPVRLVLGNLGRHVHLLWDRGMLLRLTPFVAPAGNPSQLLNVALLIPGQPVTITLRFLDPGGRPVGFTPRLLEGLGVL
jgi:uncharacterized delta-60 repeat protein